MAPVNKFLMSFLLYKATYIITGTFYFNFRHPLTLQPQTHFSPAGAARFTFSGWLGLDLLYTISLLWGFTLLWGNGWMLLRKHLKFLLIFILRARGIFQSNNIDHKNLCRFLGSVLPSPVDHLQQQCKVNHVKKNPVLLGVCLRGNLPEKAKGPFYQSEPITKNSETFTVISKWF